MYNYFEAVKNDVEDAINENYNLDDYTTREEFEEVLNDELWVDDAVTGNGSGSYFFNTYKAEEALCHNFDLLAEACENFCCDMSILKDGAEACDVTIRCYLLNQAINEVLDEIF